MVRKNAVFLLIFLSVLFMPLPAPVFAKSQSSPEMGEKVSFRSGKYQLFGLFFEPAHANGYGIVVCPGASTKGCRNILYPEISRRLEKLGYTCLLFDYRGYGKSSGPKKITSPECLNFTKDAVSAVSFLKKQRPDLKKIVIIGHSMGGGIAISAGVRDERIGKIISFSPGRRVTELFLKKNAPLGLQWIQLRMQEDMTTKVKIPLSLIKKITLPICIDSYRNFVFLKPVLFIEGTYEDKKDINFLINYVKHIRTFSTKEHILLPTNHWCGTADGTRVVFPVAIHILVVTIDAWIRNDEIAMKDIFKKVKRGKRLRFN